MSFLPQHFPEDYPPRLDYAQIIRGQLNIAFGYQEGIFFSDQCIFHSNGVVNKHIARVWGLENGMLSERCQ